MIKFNSKKTDAMDVYDRTHRNVEERESMYENEIAQITAKIRMRRFIPVC